MNADTYQPQALSLLAATLYREETGIQRLKQTYRPYICPFATVIRAVPAGAAVLDVGCGAGLFLLLLARQGLISRGHGFDISAAAVRSAQLAAGRSGLDRLVSFETRQPDAGLPDGTWNVITSIDVLHHVPRHHQRSFFSRLCSAVPSGGRLIIKDMVRSPRWRSFANSVHDLLLARELVSHLDPEEVCQWAETEGVRSTPIHRENTLWYGHWTTTFIRD